MATVITMAGLGLNSTVTTEDGIAASVMMAMA
jgi:hypothetical protein